MLPETALPSAYCHSTKLYPTASGAFGNSDSGISVPYSAVRGSDEFAGESRIKAYRVDFVAVFRAESRITRKIITAAEKFGTVNRPIFKRFALMLRRLGKSLCHNGISDGHIQSFQHLVPSRRPPIARCRSERCTKQLYLCWLLLSGFR